MKIHIIAKGLQRPVREKGSVGIDLRCAEGIKIFPRESGRINLGITWDPEGEENFLLLLPRSSFFRNFKLIHVGSGLIDPSYCGPEDVIKFEVFNPSHDEAVHVPFDWKICQAIIFPNWNQRFTIIYGPNTDHHANRGGFGSTGN